MTAIRIERLSDTHDCDTCGCTWADGANVYFDGELVMEMKPAAHCFGGKSYEDHEIQKAILEKLGHTLVYSTDEAVEAAEHTMTTD